MAQTNAQLINTILSDLNVVGSGQAAADEDFAAVQSRVVTMVADLQNRGIAYVPNLDKIEDGAFEPLVDYLVARLGPSYGRSELDWGTLQLMEMRIREASRPPRVRATLGTDDILRIGSRRVLSKANYTSGNF